MIKDYKNYKDVQRIIDYFHEKRNFSLWDIGTSIKHIVTNFYYNFQLNKKVLLKDNPLKVIVFILEKRIRGGKNKLYFSCGEIIMTPMVSYKNDYVSPSTMNQYVNVLQAFGIIEEIGHLKSYSLDLDLLNQPLINDFWEMAMKNLKNKAFYGDNKVARRIIYSTIISHLTLGFDDGEIFNLRKVRSQRIIPFDVASIKKISKDSGLDALSKEINKWSFKEEGVLEEISNFINKSQ